MHWSDACRNPLPRPPHDGRGAPLLIAAAAVSILLATMPSPAGAQPASGVEVFTRVCAACHDGAPTSRAPNLDALRTLYAAGDYRRAADRRDADAGRATDRRRTSRRRRACQRQPMRGGGRTRLPAGVPRRRRSRPGAASRRGTAGVRPGQYARQTGRPGGARRGGVSRTHAQMGVRLSRFERRVLAADASSAAACSSAARAARSIRSTPGPAASTGRSAARAASHRGRRRRVARRPGRYAAYFGDLARQRLRRRRRRPVADLGPQGGRASVGADHRLADAVRQAASTCRCRRSRRRMAANPDYACCTFRGSVVALDAATGAHDLEDLHDSGRAGDRSARTPPGAAVGPSGAAIWSSPTIDAERRRIYVATGNMYTGPQQPTSDAVMALDLDDGGIVWSWQVTPNDVFPCRLKSQRRNCPRRDGPDFDFGNSPILRRLPNGRDIIVIGQKSGIGWALDPDSKGAVVWQYRAGSRAARSAASSGARRPTATARISRSPTCCATDAGGLHAVSLGTGERVWYTPPRPPLCGSRAAATRRSRRRSPSSPAWCSPAPKDGGLRAYATTDGAVPGSSTPSATSRPSTACRRAAPRSTAPARPSSAAWSSSIPATGGAAAGRATCCSRSACSNSWHRLEDQGPADQVTAACVRRRENLGKTLCVLCVSAVRLFCGRFKA